MIITIILMIIIMMTNSMIIIMMIVSTVSFSWETSVRRNCEDTLDQCRSLSSYTNLAFQRSITVENHFDDSSDNDHAFDYVFFRRSE